MSVNPSSSPAGSTPTPGVPTPPPLKRMESDNKEIESKESEALVFVYGILTPKGVVAAPPAAKPRVVLDLMREGAPPPPPPVSEAARRARDAYSSVQSEGPEYAPPSRPGAEYVQPGGGGPEYTQPADAAAAAAVATPQAAPSPAPRTPSPSSPRLSDAVDLHAFVAAEHKRRSSSITSLGKQILTEAQEKERKHARHASLHELEGHIGFISGGVGAGALQKVYRLSPLFARSADELPHFEAEPLVVAISVIEDTNPARGLPESQNLINIQQYLRDLKKLSGSSENLSLLCIAKYITAANGQTSLATMFHNAGDLEKQIASMSTKSADPDRLYGMAADMCEGVAQLHNVGIVHRDIRPSNFLCQTHDGQLTVRLADFSKCTFAPPQHPRTAWEKAIAASQLKKPPYFIPEQVPFKYIAPEFFLAYMPQAKVEELAKTYPEINGMPRSPSLKESDIFQLAISLYELYAGVSISTTKDGFPSFLETTKQINTTGALVSEKGARCNPPSEWWPHFDRVPLDVQEQIKRMVAYDPAKRPTAAQCAAFFRVKAAELNKKLEADRKSAVPDGRNAAAAAAAAPLPPKPSSAPASTAAPETYTTTEGSYIPLPPQASPQPPPQGQGTDETDELNYTPSPPPVDFE